jgi:signal transduction histidine kinase
LIKINLFKIDENNESYGEEISMSNQNVQNNKSRILIIDDEVPMVDACSQLLRREGYIVDSAFNGEEGLKKIIEIKPDLIIVDLKMPKMSGMELLEKCREIDEHIISIVITGYATLDSAIEAMKKGAYDFLPKPFSPDSLRMIVKRGLERRNLIKNTSFLKEEKKKMEENFVTMATHQLKSHIAVIQQYFEVMMSGLTGNIPDAQKNIMEKTVPRLEGLRKIIDDWLVFARINYDELKENYKPVNIPDVIEKVVSQNKSLAVNKGVNVTFGSEGQIPQVSGHELSLEQAFSNLIVNAINYNRMDGSVIITVKTSGSDVITDISDTGIGINEKDLPLIFEQFYRARTDAVRNVPGSGLGLSIAKKLIDIHSGRIKTTSESGKGSTFTVILPAIM